MTSALEWRAAGKYSLQLDLNPTSFTLNRQYIHGNVDLTRECGSHIMTRLWKYITHLSAKTASIVMVRPTMLVTIWALCFRGSGQGCPGVRCMLLCHRCRGQTGHTLTVHKPLSLLSTLFLFLVFSLQQSHCDCSPAPSVYFSTFSPPTGIKRISLINVLAASLTRLVEPVKVPYPCNVSEFCMAPNFL